MAPFPKNAFCFALNWFIIRNNKKLQLVLYVKATRQVSGHFLVLLNFQFLKIKVGSDTFFQSLSHCAL